jgi:hypothetical protein
MKSDPWSFTAKLFVFCNICCNAQWFAPRSIKDYKLYL